MPLTFFILNRKTVISFCFSDLVILLDRACIYKENGLPRNDCFVSFAVNDLT